MIEIIEKYPSIIKNYKIIHQRNDSKISELKARITFIDSSILEFTEIFVHDIKKRKYSYQWMDANFELKIRWDNALHYPNLATFPHHKHVENDVLASEEVFLADVMIEIEIQINKVNIRFM